MQVRYEASAFFFQPPFHLYSYIQMYLPEGVRSCPFALSSTIWQTQQHCVSKESIKSLLINFVKYCIIILMHI